MATTRPVLKIFISSTSVDLTDYRDKVRAAVAVLKNLPVMMETFSAKSGQPASECMREAAEADAVICIVAHRYGYVPTKELGGDGERSITWLEVDAARKAGKKIFAFVVDDKEPWSAIKEQDRLTTEPEEKHAEIVKSVKKLKEFKTYLGSEFTFRTFKNADHLATQVALTVAAFSPAAVVHTARIWQPLFCHALQPAQHFRGRAAKLDTLKRWLESPVTPDRVVSVVAAGGTGKTALVDKALHDAKLSDRAGFFVWSFYEDPHTDAFLREAYVYFTGETNAPAGGMLERLQIALSGDLPHVLVLDGLERVQSEGITKRRGELEDLQLKRLLRALAGGIGNARAVVTSRFPLVDLESWSGAGHMAIALDDLERSAALDVLRAWQVKGDDATLIRLIEPLNVSDSYHALSVAVLGSYIGNFAGGDPAGAPHFVLDEASEGDVKARKLHRILEEYSRALTQPERDLLARLSLFPRGVRVEFLGWIVEAGGTVAGALIGQSGKQLVGQLERLKQLGLVFRYETGAEAVYSAHPFLRDFFRTTLSGAKAEDVHESVRAKLALTLDSSPATPPKDPVLLDQYEFLIEQSLLAGRTQEAFHLYSYGTGDYANLGRNLGENERGLRMLEGFFPLNDFERHQATLSHHDQGFLINDLGLFATNFGDLTRAENAFLQSQKLAHSAGEMHNESKCEINLSRLAQLGGLFPLALKHAQRAVGLADTAGDRDRSTEALSIRAAAHFAVGKGNAARADFATATGLKGEQLDSLDGFMQAESLFLTGNRAGSQTQLLAGLEIAQKYYWSSDICRRNTLLSRVLIPRNPAEASEYLNQARRFAESSGRVEFQLRRFHAACEFFRHTNDLPQSIAEGESGILLADTCGFGKFSIDIRIALAEAYLAASNYQKALQTARTALDLSVKEDCQYAWGQADGLHFCGLAHLRLNEPELARQRLTAALAQREKLGHGRIAETRKALLELREPGRAARA